MLPVRIDKLTSIEGNFLSASAFQVQYLTGQACLKIQKGQEAAASFQKILNHRGEAPISPIYPLAYLRLARAQMKPVISERSLRLMKSFSIYGKMPTPISSR